ncbi:TIGR03808 family TAT-translocated repetitive protein [Chelatococcus sp. GCM10030263]|uniref:TIGR03808 family TAT-translocated repetitive protein n=1 Tax=Chelatococcus sp. GCM10030263 TaxID=3273387 RepID=UPI00361D7C40
MDESRRAVLVRAAGGAATLGAAALGIAPAIAQDRGRSRPANGPAGNLGLDATAFGLNPGSPDDQSAALGRAIVAAARRQAPLVLPPGRYRASAVPLMDGTVLIGLGDQARLVQAGDGPILTAGGLKRLRLQSLILDGMARRVADGRGLAEMEDTADAVIDGCVLTAAGDTGLVMRRSGGEVTGCRFTDMGSSALFTLDATGLAILDNVVATCRNNGIQIWRSAAGEDRTIVRGNRVSDIHFDAGGTGQNGNGISVFRAGGVLIEGNVVRDCALTAIRNNSGANCQMIGNSCTRSGEMAIYSEFAFQGAIIANNVIDDAATGISITNFDYGGRLAVCSGNLVRNTTRRPLPYTGKPGGGVGIHVEAEAAVAGNAVEGASDIGISAGWSYAMRNLAVTGNMVRGSPVGISVSIVPEVRNALIANNVIAGATKGAVVGFRYEEAVTGDLTKAPDERASGIRVEGNAVGS